VAGDIEEVGKDALGRARLPAHPVARLFADDRTVPESRASGLAAPTPSARRGSGREPPEKWSRRRPRTPFRPRRERFVVDRQRPSCLPCPRFLESLEKMSGSRAHSPSRETVGKKTASNIADPAAVKGKSPPPLSREQSQGRTPESLGFFPAPAATGEEEALEKDSSAEPCPRASATGEVRTGAGPERQSGALSVRTAPRSAPR
ncbi:hypothetical protein HPB47_025246, partial [Ixodes persulcatus]